MGPQNVRPLRVLVDLGVMVMKEYFLFTRYPELEPQDPMVYNDN